MAEEPNSLKHIHSIATTITLIHTHMQSHNPRLPLSLYFCMHIENEKEIKPIQQKSYNNTAIKLTPFSRFFPLPQNFNILEGDLGRRIKPLEERSSRRFETRARVFSSQTDDSWLSYKGIFFVFTAYGSCSSEWIFFMR